MLVPPKVLTPDWLRTLSDEECDQFGSLLYAQAFSLAAAYLGKRRIGPHTADDVAQDAMVTMLFCVLPFTAMDNWMAFLHCVVRRRINQLRRLFGNRQVAFSLLEGPAQRNAESDAALPYVPGEADADLPASEAFFLRQFATDMLCEMVEHPNTVMAFANIAFVAEHRNAVELHKWLLKAFPDRSPPSLRSLQEYVRLLRMRIDEELDEANWQAFRWN
jgi:DNA-directed RNA polymerase specialized sigma24 family protein